MSHEMKITLTVDGADIKVTCGYYYTPGQEQTHDQEGFDESVEVYSVMDGNVDITHALTDAETKEAEAIILAMLRAQARADAQEDGA